VRTAGNRSSLLHSRSRQESICATPELPKSTSYELHTNSLGRTPNDSAMTLQELWFDKQREFVGYTDRGLYLKRRPCLRHIADEAVDRCGNSEYDGATLKGAQARASAVFIHLVAGRSRHSAHSSAPRSACSARHMYANASDSYSTRTSKLRMPFARWHSLRAAFLYWSDAFMALLRDRKGTMSAWAQK